MIEAILNEGLEATAIEIIWGTIGQADETGHTFVIGSWQQSTDLALNQSELFRHLYTVGEVMNQVKDITNIIMNSPLDKKT